MNREKLSSADLQRIIDPYILKPETIEQAKIEIVLLIIDRWNLWGSEEELKKDLVDLKFNSNNKIFQLEARNAELLIKLDKIKVWAQKKFDYLQTEDAHDKGPEYAFHLMDSLLLKLNE